MQPPLASKLRSAREQRGLSLADVAHETRIPIPRLKQLEEGNIAAFGNLAYARSFLRIYSDYLGVDAGAFIKELPVTPALGGRNDYRHLVESFGPWVDDQPRRRASRHFKDPVPASARGVYALVLFAALFVCSAVIVANFIREPAKSPPVHAGPAMNPSQPLVVAKTSSSGIQAKPSSEQPPAAAATKTEPAKLVSFVPGRPAAAEEVRPPDFSQVPVMRATPVAQDELDPDTNQ